MIVSAVVRIYTKSDKMYEIPCHRHADAFYIVSQFLNQEEVDKTRTEQGFLTHDDTFMNRIEAMQEAIKCGQLPPGADAHCKELYSEDLW